MKRAALFFIGASVCIFLIAFLAVNYFSAKQERAVCFNSFCFKAEIAKSSAELAKGLMFRKILEQDRGMLFVFEEEGDYPFWMKNTLIPLDMIWINSDSKVVFISENNLPCPKNDCSSINPNQNAKYVLEINAGEVKNIGLKVGDELEMAP